MVWRNVRKHNKKKQMLFTRTIFMFLFIVTLTFAFDASVILYKNVGRTEVIQ